MQIRLRVDDASHQTAEVTELAPGRFCLEATPLVSPESVYLGDVIEAERRPDGTHRFVRIAERAPMRHYAWVVPRGGSAPPTTEPSRRRSRRPAAGGRAAWAASSTYTCR